MQNMFRLIAAVSVSIFLAACGGGGSSAPAAGTTVVAGVVSKGPFTKGSTVNVYAVANGIKGALIAQTQTTDDKGSYSANLGGYTGPIIIEASGSYLDEATGRTVPVSAAAPIRAALPLAQGSVTLPVTALTELAVRNAGATLTPAAISAANTLVSSIFKLDIIATLPVAPTAATIATATQAQKDYTLALAAVSQMASGATGSSDADRLEAALTTLGQGISSTGMASDAVAGFTGALDDFVGTNPNNQTGISDTFTTSLMNIGTLSKSYLLALQGTITAGAVKGAQFNLVLPQGVTVNTSSLDSTVLASSLALSGNTPSDVLLATRYTPGTVAVALISTQGLGAGTFATLTCNIPLGTTAPPASAFTISGLKVVDGQGTPLAGVTVTVN